MADLRAHELAELATQVFPPLPCNALAVCGDETSGTPVTLHARDGDRYLVAWAASAVPVGDHVELHVTRDRAVFNLQAEITGYGADGQRFLSLTELRRRAQRRAEPRTPTDEMVIVSLDQDIDGLLVDLSAAGCAFQLDRPLAIDSSIRLVVNFHGKVFPTRAIVRNSSRMADGVYRLGCEFTDILEPHRLAIERHALNHPIDRRTIRHGRIHEAWTRLRESRQDDL
jgi:hypothetical protein